MLKRLIVLIAVLAASVAPARASVEIPFVADFDGTFSIEFGAGAAHSPVCSLGDDLLVFDGAGTVMSGMQGTIHGESCLQHQSLKGPHCVRIKDIVVRATVPGGDEIDFDNRADDCLDTTSEPGRVFIVDGNEDVYTIIGGSGRFAHAAGTGSIEVHAEVLHQTAGGVDGTFDVLTFDGMIEGLGG